MEPLAHRQTGLKAAAFVLACVFTLNLLGPIWQTLSENTVNTEWRQAYDQESEKPEKFGEESDDKVQSFYHYHSNLWFYTVALNCHYQAPKSVFHPPTISPPPEA